MTTLDTTAIRKLADAATPGPWGVGNETAVASEMKQEASGTISYRHWIVDLDDFNRDESDYPNPVAPSADAEFIAAARTLVPALCDELDRVRAELADTTAAMAPTVTSRPAPDAATFLHSIYEDWVKIAHARLEQVDKLTAELAEAREQIAGMRAAIDEADEAVAR